MLQSLLELNNYLNTYQNLLEKEINEFKIGDDHHRALTTIRRLLKGLNFWVVDKINNLENDYLNSENKDSDERSSEIMQVIDDFNRKIIERLNKLRIEENLVDSDINEDIFMMDKLKNIREDFSNFYKSLKPKDVDLSFDKIELNNKLEKKIKIFSQRANVIEKNISNIENNYAEILGNMNKVYEDLNTFNDKLHKMGGYVTDLEIRLNKELNDSIKSIDNNYSTKLKVIVNTFDTEVKNKTRIINAEIENISNTSRTFKEFISEETSIKLTNNFKTKSETEKNWYYGFNATSAVIIVVAIWMSYSSLTDFAVNHSEEFSELDLYYLAIRLLFSFLIFSTITFTNKLAGKHYFHWKKNESTYLKLTALKSFIADMSPDKQQEIHEKLIDVYFGKEDLDPTIYKKMDNSSNDLIKFFTDKGINLVNSKKTDWNLFFILIINKYANYWLALLKSL